MFLMAESLQGLKVKNASLEMPRGGEQWGFVGAERLPLLHEGCVLQGKARAGSDRKGRVCAAVPACIHCPHKPCFCHVAVPRPECGLSVPPRQMP